MSKLVRPWLSLALCLTVSAPVAGQSGLLADIRPGGFRITDSDPGVFLQVGTRTFFTATDPLHGRELWAMDPQAFTPRLVRDLLPGPVDGMHVYAHFVPVGRGVVFEGNGSAFWFSDGTTAGTQRLLDGVFPADVASVRLRSDGQRAWIVGNSLGRGHELYVTDGTSSGTRLVRDLNPGHEDAFTGDSTLVADRGRAWFSADNGMTGQELWFSDGTAAGTRLVLDLVPGPGSSGANPVAMLGNELVFSVHRRGIPSQLVGLWITDGTAANTRRLSSTIAPVGRVIRYGAKLVFVGIEPATGMEPWVTDGSVAGTRLLADVEPGSEGSLADSFVAAMGRIWFTARDGIHGRELWSTDGTPAGTSLTMDFAAGPTDGIPGRLLVAGNRVVFASMDNYSMDVFSTDGTAGGTVRILDLPRRYLEPPPLTYASSVGAEIWFAEQHPVFGRELWRTDGTIGGTLFFFDLVGEAVGSDPRRLLANSGLRAWFLADDGQAGLEPWITDGTPNGTRLWADLNPGRLGSDPGALVDGDRVYWASANELFSTDLLGGDRRPLAQGGAFGKHLARLGDRLFFTRPGELWTLDLGRGTTQRIAAFSDPNFLDQPWSFVVTESDLYFLASDGASGQRGLWISDGTPGGTLLLQAIWDISLARSGSVAVAAVGPQRVLLLAEIGRLADFELIAFDRAVPTSLLRFRGISGRAALEVAGGRACFAAWGQGGSSQIWVSDGTLPGTSRVTDVPRPSPWLDEGIDEITAAGDLLYFRTSDQVHGRELWVTDGTVAGTRMCRDLVPGSRGSEPQGLVPIGDAPMVAFAANGSEGRELWVSDGSPSGTRLLVDVDPVGGSSGLVRPLGPVGASLIFHGHDARIGDEPRWVSLSHAGGFHAQRFGAGCAASGGSPAPVLTAAGTPTLGDGGFALEVSGAAPRAASAALLDTAPRPLAVSGCQLWVAGAAVNVPRLTDSAGTARLALPVPPIPALLDLQLHSQWLVVDRGGVLLGQASASNALRLAIGR